MPATEPSAEVNAVKIFQILQSQQAEIVQQQQVLVSLVRCLAPSDNDHKDQTQPAAFDGHSVSASHRIATYVHAYEKNGWTSGEHKMKQKT